MPDELVIRGGMLVDGTGAAPRRADVRIVDGRVAEIGAALSGPRALDASGAFVAPGFVDIHTHYDAQVFWDPWLTPSSLQGVTSVIAGHCGLSIAPCRETMRDSMMRTLHFVEDMAPDTLREGVEWTWEDYGSYRSRVAERGVGINFGTYVGHTAVRLWVLGADAYTREATDDEIAAMQAVVADAIGHGAIGFSTDRSNFHRADGGTKVASQFGSQAEVEALMRAAADAGGICAVIVDEDCSWLYRLQPQLGTRITWCQIITYPDGSPRQPWPEAQLATHREAFGAGAQVYPQATCRPITFQVSMANPMPFYPVPAFGELAALDVVGREALYRDHAWRVRAVHELGSKQWVDPNWAKFTVEESPTQASLLGRSVQDIACERRADPVATAIDIALADGLATRFRVVFANDDLPLLGQILATEGCVLGLSDAGAHIEQMCDAPLPVDFLANWVRDRELMPIERGVRKVTGELADLMGLRDRGYLAVGRPADVVVFDLDELEPAPLERVADFPAGNDRLTAGAPRGLRHVLVNGTTIREDGADRRSSGVSLPGQMLGPAAGAGS